AVVCDERPLEDRLELLLRLWRGQMSHKRSPSRRPTCNTQGADRGRIWASAPSTHTVRRGRSLCVSSRHQHEWVVSPDDYRCAIRGAVLQEVVFAVCLKASSFDHADQLNTTPHRSNIARAIGTTHTVTQPR